MIAPELRQRHGLPPRYPAAPTSLPESSQEPSRFSAAVSAARSAIGGAGSRYPLAVLITTAAVAGVAVGWFVKRR